MKNKFWRLFLIMFFSVMLWPLLGVADQLKQAGSILVPVKSSASSVMSKQQIFSCLDMQADAASHKKVLMDSGQQINQLEALLSSHEQSLQQQNGQLDKLEARATSSVAAMNHFRTVATAYNHQLETFNGLQHDYKQLLQTHNQETSRYNHFIEKYQASCGSKQYLEEDLKQVQMEITKLSSNKQ